ncbi:hypothetical protein FOL47_000778 [Perkinsus chesapeaki]|uniref:Uncharacterized protein n=1 Tax=Perkinsus chesapeaki TaxID=330153 RepID=A0A7J6KV91_PERCH|nr:hypothetical protein FOL47_000778 [Perkinsus chesapeaki]
MTTRHILPERQVTLDLASAAVAGSGVEFPRFREGDKVEYYSTTYSRWVRTTVTKVNHHELTYDLEAKSNARMNRVRTPNSRPAAATATTVAPKPGGGGGGGDAPMRGEGDYEINDGVRYYSLTHDRWVDATVIGLCDDEAYVDLDVKRKANRTRIRKRNWCPADEVRLDDDAAVTPARTKAAASSLAGSARRQTVVPMRQAKVSATATAGLLSKKRLTMSGRSSSTFDPNACFSVLVSELGLQGGTGSSSITINSMRGFTGGMNGGIWFVKVNGVNKLCLKLVSAQRKCAQLPTEADNYLDLAKRFPCLTCRSTLGGLLAFPVRIFDVLSPTPSGTSRVLFNLIAMPVAKGVRLAEILGRKVHAREDNSAILREVGRQLRRFHERLNGSTGPGRLEIQHTDFQPCNIFVDEPNLGVGENGGVTFVDLGGMGVTVKEGDYEHLVKSLRLLGQTYGQDFVRMSVSAFTDGYGHDARGSHRSGGAGGGGGGVGGSVRGSVPVPYRQTALDGPKVNTTTTNRIVASCRSPTYRIATGEYPIMELLVCIIISLAVKLELSITSKLKLQHTHLAFSTPHDSVT